MERDAQPKNRRVTKHRQSPGQDPWRISDRTLAISIRSELNKFSKFSIALDTPPRQNGDALLFFISVICMYATVSNYTKDYIVSTQTS